MTTTTETKLFFLKTFCVNYTEQKTNYKHYNVYFNAYVQWKEWCKTMNESFIVYYLLSTVIQSETCVQDMHISFQTQLIE